MVSSNSSSLICVVLLGALVILQGCALSSSQKSQPDSLELNAKGERQSYVVDRMSNVGTLTLNTVNLDVESGKGDTGLHIDFHRGGNRVANLVIDDKDCIGYYSAMLDYQVSATTRFTYYFDKQLFWEQSFDVEIDWQGEDLRVVIDGEEKKVTLYRTMKKLDLHLHKGDLQIEKVSLKN